MVCTRAVIFNHKRRIWWWKLKVFGHFRIINPHINQEFILKTHFAMVNTVHVIFITGWWDAIVALRSYSWRLNLWPPPNLTTFNAAGTRGGGPSYALSYSCCIFRAFDRANKQRFFTGKVFRWALLLSSDFNCSGFIPVDITNSVHIIVLLLLTCNPR